MPNIKSAKKRVKVNAVKALNNQMAKSELKTTLKKFDAAIAAGDKAGSDCCLYDCRQGCRSGGCQAPPA